MCTDDQHHEKMAKLHSIETLLHQHHKHAFLDRAITISANRPFTIDYMERKYLYIFSSTSFTLALEDLGSLPIAANTWTNINFPPGTRCSAPGFSSPLTLLLRATNDPLSEHSTSTIANRIQVLQTNGSGFTATTGLINQNAGTYPLSVFNPSSTKNMLIYSVRGSTGTGGGVLFLQSTTTDPAYGALTPNNRLPGGPASVASCSTTTTSQSNPSTHLLEVYTSGNMQVPTEAMSNGEVYLLPSGASNGLTAFINTFAGGYSSIGISWIEY